MIKWVLQQKCERLQKIVFGQIYFHSCYLEFYDEDSDEEERFLRRYLELTLKMLTNRERDILIERYGLGGNKVRTLEEVGAIFHVTRERIRQIEDVALRKLKRFLLI